jgi:ubiquinone/menaquinone biosynthesis C-methylase UbiE
MDESEAQRDYYTRTANNYDDLHASETPALAVAFLDSAIRTFNATSVLDIGSGTGRVIKRLTRPDLKVMGIEPVAALRQASGLPGDVLMDGDATALRFSNNSFDVVCALSVLHHIRHPEAAIGEMLRVANKAVFICDSNNFGQGRRLSRYAKQLFHAVGLWPIANYMKTGGKGYSITEGDGLAYSYSIFSNYRQIERACSRIHLLNLDGNGVAPYRSASVVALLGVKH